MAAGDAQQALDPSNRESLWDFYLGNYKGEWHALTNLFRHSKHKGSLANVADRDSAQQSTYHPEATEYDKEQDISHNEALERELKTLESQNAGNSINSVDNVQEMHMKPDGNADVDTPPSSRDFSHSTPENPDNGKAVEAVPHIHVTQSLTGAESTTLSKKSGSGILEQRDVDTEKGFAPSESKQVQEDDSPASEFLVDWTGPDDPEFPYNWPLKRKVPMIIAISVITLITPLASSMFAPGVGKVMSEFNSNSETLASFVVSVYLIGYVAGPLVCAPLSELYGRTIVYNVSNIFFTIFTIACALAQNLNQLIGFRFLAGMAGATPLVLGGGSLGDMFPPEKRGGVMALWAMGPLLGPVIGPVAGGFVASAIGWRWVFWILTIAAAVVSTCAFFVLRETYVLVLLESKAKKLRESTGDERYQSVKKRKETPRQLFLRSIIRPTNMFFRSPVVFLLSLYMATIYGYLYLLFTTINEVFEKDYGFTIGTTGLAYLGIGVGSFIGLLGFGLVSDRGIKRAQANNKPITPEIRIPPMIPGTLAVPIGLLWYGWSAEAKIHWIMPIVGTGWVGLGLIGIFMPIQTYMVDAFTIYAASAIAANTIFRSLIGAILPLAGRPLYSGLGLGWGNSLLAFIALVMAPLPYLFMKYGEFLRTNKRFKVDF